MGPLYCILGEKFAINLVMSCSAILRLFKECLHLFAKNIHAAIPTLVLHQTFQRSQVNGSGIERGLDEITSLNNT